MDLLLPKDAAEYLKVSTNTLATWRTKRRGPRFIRTGRVIKYSREDLDAYLRNNTVATETEMRLCRLTINNPQKNSLADTRKVIEMATKIDAILRIMGLARYNYAPKELQRIEREMSALFEGRKKQMRSKRKSIDARQKAIA